MKKIILFVFTLAISLSLSAQQIDSLVISPLNPTTSDVVTLYIYGTYGNSGCIGTATANVSGNMITGSAYHCMGLLTTICNDIDTVVLGTLAAGGYMIDISLSAGFGTFPNCSPPIVPNDNAQLQIQITSPTGIPSLELPIFSLSPNPSAGELVLRNERFVQGDELLLYSTDGRLAKRYALQDARTELTLDLASGMYFAVLKRGELLSAPQKLMLNR